MDFLPSAYTPPAASSNYMRFVPGENRFRILSDKPIIGWEYWTADRKPIRLKVYPERMPENIKLNDPGKHWQAAVKHFWAFAVWSYREEAVQILQINQVSIQSALTGIFQDKDWGHPKGYDISVMRTGEGMDTEYQVLTKPHKPLSKDIEAEYKMKPVHLEALFKSEDPFAPKEQQRYSDEDQLPEEVPFA